MTSSMSSQPSFSSSSSSSSSNHPPTYHVFLSFRGEDTRNNFTAHLYEALQRNGINTFIDDKLRCGEEISTTLLKTIEKSEISIIVFSKTYASSRWCLEELIKILDCRKTNKQHVLSLFYNVDPSDVRYQTNSIGEGLVELKTWYDDITVQKWRTALKEAANLSGMHLGSRNEPAFIRDIIEWVNSILGKKTYIQVAQHVVGIESPVQDLISLLNIEKKDSSYMVGIFGYSGIGKTTIAKAIYNLIASSFEGICFLEDIRETCQKDGMIYLQSKLLSTILGDPSPNVDNVDQGITLIEQRLCRFRVLLVLDDVDSLVQLVKLAGKCDWFGLGSRIIITTRKKQLLAAHGVDPAHQFQVKELDDKKALQLFSLHVFNRDIPPSDYAKVAKDVVCYSGGLPLALTELASVLKGQDICFWETKLVEYKKAPNDNIQKKLEISYDGLCQNAKDIFLHIACFFKGEDVEYVKTTLEICGFHSHTGFEDLKDNGLINDQSSGSLVLHDLLQEMGREIVRKESLNDPGKRSRLWFHEDVRSILEDETGTNSVVGIVIDMPKADLDNSPKLVNKPTAFGGMKMLKLFISRNALFSEQLHSLPNALRFLYWPKYAHKSLPSNFSGRNLLVLRMPYGRLEELKGIENFQRLTMMNLSNCENLKEVPDVSRMSKISTLILDNCVSLVKVHHSVGSLPQLVYLSFENCNKLSSFPETLQLRRLESLVLCGCSSLTNFPQIRCRMECLKNIDCQYTAIKKLPSTIENLVGVKQLFLTGCTDLTILPDNIEHLENLESLILNGCTNIEGLPSSIGRLLKVKKLDLSGCTNLMNLPNSIYQLQHLEQLDLEGCSKVKFPDDKQSMPSTASTMEYEISIREERQFSMDSNSGCCSISFPKLQELSLRNCSLSESNFFKTFYCGSGLNYLDLSGSDIVILPRCINRFVGLKSLDLNECKQLREIMGLPPNVEEVKAKECMSLEIFLEEGRRSQLYNTRDPPEPMGRGTLFPALQSSSLGNSVATKSEDCLFSLEELDLSSSAIASLPTWFNKFVELKCLTLKDCKQLREISKLPSKIEEVYAHGCTSLERFQSTNICDLPALQWIDLSDCHKMCENIGNDVQFRLLNKGYPEDYKFVCIFPGNKIPDCFIHSKEVSNSNSCEIPINGLAHLDGDITRIALCVVIGTKAHIPDGQDEIIKGGQDEDAYGIIFKVINDGVEIYSFMVDDIHGQFHSDHVWFQFVVPKPFEFKGDNFRVKFKLRSASMLFKSCGFRLVQRSEEIARDLMDGVQLSKRRRGDDDDGNFPQQKRHSSTLGIRISDAEKTPFGE